MKIESSKYQQFRDRLHNFSFQRNSYVGTEIEMDDLYMINTKSTYYQTLGTGKVNYNMLKNVAANIKRNSHALYIFGTFYYFIFVLTYF